MAVPTPKLAWNLHLVADWFMWTGVTAETRLALLRAAPDKNQLHALLVACLGLARSTEEANMVIGYMARYDIWDYGPGNSTHGFLRIYAEETLNLALITLAAEHNLHWLNLLEPWWIAHTADYTFHLKIQKLWKHYDTFVKQNFNKLFRIAALTKNWEILEDLWIPLARRNRIVVRFSRAEYELMRTKIRKLEDSWDSKPTFNFEQEEVPALLLGESSELKSRITTVRGLVDSRYSDLEDLDGFKYWARAKEFFLPCPWKTTLRFWQRAESVEDASSGEYLKMLTYLLKSRHSFTLLERLENDNDTWDETPLSNRKFVRNLLLALGAQPRSVYEYLFGMLRESPEAYVKRSELSVDGPLRLVWDAERKKRRIDAFEEKQRTVSSASKKRRATQAPDTAQRRKSLRLEFKRVDNAFTSYVSNMKRAVSNYARFVAQETANIRQSKLKRTLVIPETKQKIIAEVYKATSFVHIMKSTISKLLQSIAALRNDYIRVAEMALKRCSKALFPTIHQQLLIAQSSTQKEMRMLFTEYKNNLNRRIEAIQVDDKAPSEEQSYSFTKVMLETQDDRLYEVEILIENYLEDSESAFRQLSLLHTTQKSTCL